MEFSAVESKNKTEKDVIRMVHKFTATFHRLLSKESQNVIETDYERTEINADVGKMFCFDLGQNPFFSIISLFQ